MIARVVGDDRQHQASPPSNATVATPTRSRSRPEARSRREERACRCRRQTVPLDADGVDTCCTSRDSIRVPDARRSPSERAGKVAPRTRAYTGIGRSTTALHRDAGKRRWARAAWTEDGTRDALVRGGAVAARGGAVVAVDRARARCPSRPCTMVVRSSGRRLTITTAHGVARGRPRRVCRQAGDHVVLYYAGSTEKLRHAITNRHDGERGLPSRVEGRGATRSCSSKRQGGREGLGSHSMGSTKGRCSVEDGPDSARAYR